jgi:transcription elongation factor
MRFFDDEDDEMRTRTRNWKAALVAGAIAAGFGTAASAWDTGFNQPGAIGGHAGAPGVGSWDPGINQPGAIGNHRLLR